MKDIGRLVGVLAVGLFVAIIVYPFLHEMGHLAAAVCVGADICEYELLPSAFVMCDMTGINRFSQMLIGLSGLVFPLCFTLINHRNFWIWYAVFVLKCICLLAFILSCAALICLEFGVVWESEDVIQLLLLWGDGREASAVLRAVLLSGAAFLAVTLCNSHPIKRVMRYFDI